MYIPRCPPFACQIPSLILWYLFLNQLLCIYKRQSCSGGDCPSPISCDCSTPDLGRSLPPPGLAIRHTMALPVSSSCLAGSRLRPSAPTASLLPRPASIQPPAVARHGLRQASGLEAATSTASLRPSSTRRGSACHGFDPKDKGGSGKTASLQLNPAYVAILGGFALLFLFRNPYIFAAITILTIIPQNSAVTSLNSLVLLFYDSGLFMNFAEAVYCVRLISWVSIACTLISFALFA